MGFLHHATVLLALLAGTGQGQNCPLSGPAYPPASNAFSLGTAKAQFLQMLDQALSSGGIDGRETSFSIQVFDSTTFLDTTPLFDYHHTATSNENRSSPVGPHTLYRIGSISKLVSVYAILSKFGYRLWENPVVGFVPELDQAKFKNPIDDVDWSAITLGMLAGHQSGIGSDYALGDLSSMGMSIPGLPVLNQSEMIRCGTAGIKPCTRAEAMSLIQAKYPVASTYQTSAYSNMAFQLLGYAMEKATSRPFGDLVRNQLIKPLSLTRTFLSVPANDSNAVIVDGWTQDLGDAAPAGGYFQSITDLGKIGRSILASSVLQRQTTRRWLQPVSHTPSSAFSVGQPWEILGTKLPVSTNSKNTRLVDVYCKTGGIGQYLGAIALSPQHGLRISLLVAGPGARAAFGTLQEMALGMWLPKAEEAARVQAEVDFVGRYISTVSGAPTGGNSSRSSSSSSSSGNHNSGNSSSSVVTISLLPDEPGLFLSSFVNEGVDILAAIAITVFGSGGGGGDDPAARWGAWLYPTTSSSTTSTDRNGKDKDKSQNRNRKRVAFRAIFGQTGRPGGDSCITWSAVDAIRYAGKPVDLFIFELEEDGKAVAVEVPFLNKVFVRDLS